MLLPPAPLLAYLLIFGVGVQAKVRHMHTNGTVQELTAYNMLWWTRTPPLNSLLPPPVQRLLVVDLRHNVSLFNYCDVASYNPLTARGLLALHGNVHGLCHCLVSL